jgi:diguanylate cyclase (GGDEF)-like protein
LLAVLAWLRTIAGYVNAKREQIKRSSEKIRAQNREIQETNQKLEEALTRLNHLATTDELTGLSNRRHFMSTVRSHIDRCENDQLSFGLCMLDLDNFKEINDRWGHQIGDHVLIILADVLRDNMREYDFLARFGGEEFVLIVTRGDEDITRQCAERLRRAAENANLNSLGKDLKMTITVGATVFQSGDTLETALDRADRAMYRGKHMGRNICCFEPEVMNQVAASVGSGGTD